MNKFLVLLLLVVSNTLSGQVIVDILPPKPGIGIELAKSKYEKNPKNPVLSYYRLSKKPLF